MGERAISAGAWELHPRQLTQRRLQAAAAPHRRTCTHQSVLYAPALRKRERALKKIPQRERGGQGYSLDRSISGKFGAESAVTLVGNGAKVETIGGGRAGPCRNEGGFAQSR